MCNPEKHSYHMIVDEFYYLLLCIYGRFDCFSFGRLLCLTIHILLSLSLSVAALSFHSCSFLLSQFIHILVSIGLESFAHMYTAYISETLHECICDFSFSDSENRYKLTLYQWKNNHFLYQQRSMSFRSYRVCLFAIACDICLKTIFKHQKSIEQTHRVRVKKRDEEKKTIPEFYVRNEIPYDFLFLKHKQ